MPDCNHALVAHSSIFRWSGDHPAVAGAVQADRASNQGHHRGFALLPALPRVFLSLLPRQELIEKAYLERTEADRNCLNYLA